MGKKENNYCEVIVLWVLNDKRNVIIDYKFWFDFWKYLSLVESKMEIEGLN